MGLSDPKSRMYAHGSISARNVTLRIPTLHKGAGSILANPFALLASFYMPRQAKRELRTILDDVNFEVEDGSRLGLIGPNGAGKTTLLRLLAGSISPTRGSVVTTGKVQALLNIHQGFRLEATGLENVYLRGLCMGMTLAEIRSTIPEIVEFSELSDAIYDPMQTYSAGMRARLAFSIVTARTPNILLMDEWISAGDRFFVEKAQQRLQAQIEVCRVLVIASHSASILQEICTHGLVLDAGRNMFFGKIDDALKFYEHMTPCRARAAEECVSERAATAELNVRRVFSAPLDRVWKGWTDPKQLTEWWLPKDFEAEVTKLDVAPGGVFHYGLRSPRGRKLWGRVVFTEVAAGERLSFITSYSNEKGEVIRNPFNPTCPLQIAVEASFTEDARKTVVDLRIIPYSSSEEERIAFIASNDWMLKSFAAMLDQLTDLLARPNENALLENEIEGVHSSMAG